MNLKELDQMFAEKLTEHLCRQNFKGQGQRGARHGYRQVAPNIQQLIATPCVPSRGGGGSVGCGVAVRFDDIEHELALLTDGSTCFQPSPQTATIGATLDEIRGPASHSFRGHLTDAPSVERVVRELAPLLNQFVIPWLDRMKDYEEAYRECSADLARHPIRHSIDVARTYLLAKKLGMLLDDSPLRHLRRIVDADEIGADVCRRVLAEQELNNAPDELHPNSAQ